MNRFILRSNYSPTGDQPAAIDSLVNGVNKGYKDQVLMGATGTGKTFTIANVIARTERPTLVLAHNKTLAGQLYSEFKEFFPDNEVCFFVSYYDYYQPEAYIPGKDMYIEKDAMINDEIDMLRHNATSALLERRDVIVVSSVSCIYSLGDPQEYKSQVISIRSGMEMDRNDLIDRLVSISYERNDINFVRDKFRVKGDTLDVFPASYSEKAIRIEFFGDEIDRISEFNPITGEIKRNLKYYSIYPATHYAVSQNKREKALEEIEKEMNERIQFFKDNNKFIEAQRIEQRTRYDIEMLREIGFCHGIENYSRILAGREPGSTPYTLLDFFPDDYLMIIDESHVSVPQIRGMSHGDRARKENLVEYGFRLPSALDNRPLNFDEFRERQNQVIYVSATPDEYEKNISVQVVEQLIRPTGLVDPEIDIRPIDGQVDDLISEIRTRVEKKERTLVTTLTKKMAEDLTDYLQSYGIKVKYIHHTIESLERLEIIRDLRMGVFDVLVGINLLREGLDIPEVSLVAILDADKEGFLRSETSLIQTVGRAARNVNGKVIMYADVITKSIRNTVSETERRRTIQTEYNRVNGITPRSVEKDIREVIDIAYKDVFDDSGKNADKIKSPEDREKMIERLTKEMRAAASSLEFEKAIFLRDRISKLKSMK